MQTSLVNPLGVYDSSTSLWLQGKGQQDKQDQQDQQGMDIQTDQSTLLLAKKQEDFNRQLREQPADTQLWIKFIHYQVWRLTHMKTEKIWSTILISLFKLIFNLQYL